MTTQKEDSAVDTVAKLNEVEIRLNGFFAEREDEIHLLTLGAVSGHNLFLIGDPGTGKDALIQAFVEAWEFYHSDNKKYFRRLFGPTLSPDEIFGGLDIKEFENGNFVRNTKGFAPECLIFNGTELFKGNDVINNTLLDFFNEHKFRNGGTDTDVPLLFAVASSNEMPDDNQGALVDRFSLKKSVQPVVEKGSLSTIWKNRIQGVTKPVMDDIQIEVEGIHAARELIDEVDVSDAMLEIFWLILDELKKDGLYVSVRKQNHALDILRAEAVLNGRVDVDSDDFAVLQHVLWNEPEDAKKVLQIILRVANPMMDEIHTGIDAAKRALDNARDDIKGVIEEDDRIRAGAQARHEIESVLNALKQMDSRTNSDSKTGKEIKRALGRVMRYQKALLTEVFGLDVEAMANSLS